MNRVLILLVVLAAVIVVPCCYVLAQSGATHIASAMLKDPNGRDVGFARFTEDPGGLVHVNVQVNGLSPGRHGIHIHETGNCTGPAFAAVGGHYNPIGKHHGLNNTGGPHAGDLPNLVVGGDGTGRMIAATDRVTLSPGPTTLLGKNGTSLVIHADPDDQMSDPSGNSGKRIACGVIRAA